MSATSTATDISSALEAIDRLADLVEEEERLHARVIDASQEMWRIVEGTRFPRWEAAVVAEARNIDADILARDESQGPALVDLLVEIREFGDLVKKAGDLGEGGAS